MGNTTNAFFGLHMTNDPNWTSSKHATRTVSLNILNSTVCDDPVAYTTNYIAKGEELFLKYHITS
jgi:hypothetical protein